MFHNKNASLPHNPLLQERKIRLRWLLLVSTLPFLGVVAAFGIAPQSPTPPPAALTETLIATLNLPQPEAPVKEAQSYWYDEKIQAGDTLASLLTRLHVKNPQSLDSLREHASARALAQLMPGKVMRAQVSEEGELLALHYLNDTDSFLEIDKQGDNYHAGEKVLFTKKILLMKSGKITRSLFAATDEARVPDNVATQLAEIFSSQIDFHLDLRKGDQFTVVYEGYYHNGELVQTGRVLAAEFINGGKSHRAILFEAQTGRSSYYTPEGMSLRKAFLRSPLEFSRVSSGFTHARFHPVLKTWRAHKGVDYAAPSGTRIRATADGIVSFAGGERGYGNLVVVQHTNKYSTAYGHLSQFARGVKRGTRVNQGDIIGYVGMTGLATGPHLHYEFRIAGVQHNPLSTDMPIAMPLNGQEKLAFHRHASLLASRLNLLRHTDLAMLE